MSGYDYEEMAKDVPDDYIEQHLKICSVTGKGKRAKKECAIYLWHLCKASGLPPLLSHQEFPVREMMDEAKQQQ